MHNVQAMDQILLPISLLRDYIIQIIVLYSIL